MITAERAYEAMNTLYPETVKIKEKNGILYSFSDIKNQTTPTFFHIPVDIQWPDDSREFPVPELEPCRYCGMLPHYSKNFLHEESDRVWHPESKDCPLSKAYLIKDRWPKVNRTLKDSLSVENGETTTEDSSEVEIPSLESLGIDPVEVWKDKDNPSPRRRLEKMYMEEAGHMKKIIIAGGRDLGDFSKCSPAERAIKERIYSWLIIIVSDYIRRNNRGEEIVILSGRCGRSDFFDPEKKNFSEGGDGIGERVAIELTVPVASFPAEWKKHPGKSAGPIRNGLMVNAAYKTGGELYALPGGIGTNNIVTQAMKAGLTVVDLRRLI